ncbi:SCO3374 family protein [Streptomyces sp. NPDC050610]|uniref:SCO3374 family protein n=1 Tax=Streptomyces sp. NPDC050610 TaxID=3157097 RepID=UPI0034493EA2
MTPVVPVPRPRAPLDAVRRWYERELGWPATGGSAGEPVHLLTGVRFDVLEVPSDAGFAVLRRVARTGPVAYDPRAGAVRLLVAAGSADELPGLLDWLEWGGIALDLTVLGPGGRIAAPTPDAVAGSRETVWVRPPEPGCEVEPTLPVTGLGDGGGAPDLVRLVGAAATECHRARLLRASGARSGRPSGFQPLAFS